MNTVDNELFDIGKQRKILSSHGLGMFSAHANYLDNPLKDAKAEKGYEQGERLLLEISFV